MVEHAICDRPATLVYLAGQACIEIHGFTSRADRVDRPDQLVIDFDPPDATRFADVRRAALWARELLAGELGLTSYVRTTGGRGLHVHVGLDRRAGFEPVREFAHAAAGLLARRHPDLITTEQRKDKRGTRIYADVMRNAYAQTVVANYAVRARPSSPPDRNRAPRSSVRGCIRGYVTWACLAGQARRLRTTPAGSGRGYRRR